MKINLFDKIVGTGFFTGFSPVASGTVGSIVAYAVYLIPGLNTYEFLLPAIILSFIYGIFIGTKFEKVYGKDPSVFTLDEFTGSWIALLALPDNFYWLIANFFLWRILDIFKPYPANRLEKLHGGWGIMLDDVVSGFYAALILILIKYYIF